LSGYNEAALGKPLDTLTPDDIPEDYEVVAQAFSPLDRYFYDGVGLAEAELAFSKLELEARRECMASRGFDDSAAPPSLEIIEDGLYEAIFGSPLANPAAREYGYGIFNPRPSRDSGEQAAGGEGFYEAHNECVAEAVGQVQQAEAWEAYSTIEVRGLEPYDEALEAGQRAQMKCLAEQGLPEDPSQYYSELADQYRDELYSAAGLDQELQTQLAAEELTAAQADWGCYRQHVLLPYLRLVLARGTAMLEANPEALAKVREDLRRGLD
jgi:hypothetical protein